MMTRLILALFLGASSVAALSLAPPAVSRQASSSSTSLYSTVSDNEAAVPSRRAFLVAASSLAVGAAFVPPAEAVGPVRVDLINPVYSAKPCPPSKPIPGEKAMKGMRGLCVTVDADIDTVVTKDLEKVGVYGFVTDAQSGESVLANNPDLSTDAGQFAMIETITPTDKKVQFEFVAAIPKETDISQYENGIPPLSFESLRIVSYPGGQQYGAISPCEMNEFSVECEDWEAENGPYVKGKFMIQSNPRTKGR